VILMTTTSSLRWRVPLFLAGVVILAGAPRHPRGTMTEMLAHPDWVMAHTLVLVGFVVLLAALVMLHRGGAQPARTARWVRFAAVATLLQAIEMAVHTAAVVDHGHLAAGQATPVLTTHLALSVVIYPLFGAAIVGFILAAARERAAGSWWIAWLGVIGATAHGLAAPLVVLSGDTRFAILFPGIALLALWMVLAALWPVRAPADVPHRASPPPVPAAR
jgi:cytochrome bd-type quinol oxidase subunit 2